MVEAAKAIAMLKADRSAVAITEVLQELHKVIRPIKRRLEICDVGLATQTIERDITDSRQDIIKAVTKG
jgi:hypothetical protein